MRIEITHSARKHGVTDSEIRATVEFPVARQAIPNRRHPADLYLYAGAVDENQPHLEVIADHLDDGTAVVFHAMFLRPTTYKTHLEGLFHPRYAPQRA